MHRPQILRGPADMFLHSRHSALTHTAKISEPNSLLTSQICLVHHLHVAFSDCLTQAALIKLRTNHIQTQQPWQQLYFNLASEREWWMICNYVDDFSRKATNIETMQSMCKWKHMKMFKQIYSNSHRLQSLWFDQTSCLLVMNWILLLTRSLISGSATCHM